MFGDAPFHIVFTVTYVRLNLPRESVEVLMVRESASDEARGSMPPSSCSSTVSRYR